MKRSFVVAITGASGAAYSVRLVEVLLSAGCDVHLTISAAAQTVLKQELNLTVDLENFQSSSLRLEMGQSVEDQKLRRIRELAGISSEASTVLAFPIGSPGELYYHHYRDMQAPIASGSFLTDGMVICPCSGGTLSAIVHGTSANLIHRAAEVHLKEHRPLILVPRETPLALPQLENMRRAVKAGAVLLPAMPGFYHGVKGVQDLIDFIVSRICDQLHVPNDLIHRWGT